MVVFEHEGNFYPITSPWIEDHFPLDHVFPDNFLFFQAGHIPSSDDNFIDFFSPSELSSLHRWHVDNKGAYLFQEKVKLFQGKTVQEFVQLRNTIETITDCLKKCNNDYSIFSFLEEAVSRDIALGYINEFAVSIPKISSDSDVLLVVLFNHNFVRNVDKLYALYSNRFPAIDFILPCVAPDHPSFFSYPFGSYQFHGLIWSYLRDAIASKRISKYKNIIFVQDDMVLHPSITHENYIEKLELENNAIAFGQELTLFTSEAVWDWADRINNALYSQFSTINGNGFNGLTPLVLEHDHYYGLSDFFALSTEYIEAFSCYLLPYVAANIFPELAIPSVLMHLSAMYRAPFKQITGLVLWDENRDKVQDVDYIASFIQSDHRYLHPVKLSSLPQAVYELLANKTT